MRSSLRIMLIGLAVPMLARSSERARSASQVPHSDADSSVTVRFLGCYLLTVNSRGWYQIRLTMRPVGTNWEARAYGSSARNVAGDSWIWAPIDTNAFRIMWGGIDSAMDFRITRHGSDFDASGIMYGQGIPSRHTPLETRVQRLTCPPLYI